MFEFLKKLLLSLKKIIKNMEHSIYALFTALFALIFDLTFRCRQVKLKYSIQLIYLCVEKFNLKMFSFKYFF